MLANLPQETTELLIDLCTSLDGDTGSDEDSSSIGKSGAASPNGTIPGGGPSYLSYLRGNTLPMAPASDTATIAAQSIKTVKGRAATAGEADTSRSSTPPPVAAGTQSDPPSAPQQPISGLPVKQPAPPPPPLKRLSPKLYFAHFVDHMDQFVVFLETVALRRWGQSVEPNAPAPSPSVTGAEDQEDDKADQEAVWNTLLELYLTSGSDKALGVLESKSIPYDTTHALILCSVHQHADGLVHLWERLGMYEDVIRFYIDRKDAPAVMRSLRRYGEENPGLYPLVLRFLTAEAGHEEDVKEVLGHIAEKSIMTPVAVIQVLSRNNVTSVGLVKDWLMSRIKEARKEIEAVCCFLTELLCLSVSLSFATLSLIRQEG
jgi:vacuolar protein sorting-associated protein 11